MTKATEQLSCRWERCSAAAMPEMSSFLEDGKAHIRQIRIAHLSEGLADVAEGVRPGEIVVLYPPAALAERSRINPK
ncbi:hypothetical protein HGP16_18610 [Rhizobium sp. P40RR-XXII]|uniref:hypothetical protein n=1 Tax=Rhizobium sp. P40RR-XXII TaxID=2726739 RepID=UPI0014570C09|nr:hypothetical protein [Rhizobium sp. P40RR-XXII]NLS18572.1 hypothetical protein [Rhizobium sp. P40RR-XXII]